MTLFGEKDVLGLEISMDHANILKVLENEDQFGNIKQANLLCQPMLTLGDKISQIASLTMLQRKVKTTFVLEAVDKLDHPWMSHPP